MSMDVIALAMLLLAVGGCSSLQLTDASSTCQCCDQEGNAKCCIRCTRENESEADAADLPDIYSRIRRQSAFRSRFASSCSCCFTRRLPWCCDICSSYAKRGYSVKKRSNIPHTASEDRLSPFSSDFYLATVPEKDLVGNGAINQNVEDFAAVSNNDDCLCCLMDPFGPCCLKCMK